MPLRVSGHNPHAVGFESCHSVDKHVVLWNWVWTQQSSFRKRKNSLVKSENLWGLLCCREQFTLRTKDILYISYTLLLMVRPSDCSPLDIPLYSLWKRKWKQLHPDWVHCTMWEAWILHHKTWHSLERRLWQGSLENKGHTDQGFTDQ